MNIFLWILQIFTALLYGASGCMKVFMFDKVSEGVTITSTQTRIL